MRLVYGLRGSFHIEKFFFWHTRVNTHKMIINCILFNRVAIKFWFSKNIACKKTSVSSFFVTRSREIQWKSRNPICLRYCCNFPGPRRVNHASVAIGDHIYSFGGYCSGEDYRISRPIDVHVLNTNTLRWSLLPMKNQKYPQVPFQRYGE